MRGKSPQSRTTTVRFGMDLSAEEYLRYYEGVARSVIVHGLDGRHLQIPAHNFRPYITAGGIHGVFEITLDENNKLLEMKKVT
ncbi:MAG: DUF2835 domain-containing protein [Sedimenticola sp.]